MSSPSRKFGKSTLRGEPARAEAASRIVGEGEMADLIRNFPWNSSVLGPVECWPDTLVTTVNMLLASRHPMFLWWGPELIQFYNDGYRPSIRADKHPKAVGQRGVECWPEIWSIIGPQIDSVMSEGRATWHANQLVPINRDGRLEEVYWTYSYSPIRDSQGAVQGTLVVCSETTEQVLSERRLKTLLAVTAREESDARKTPANEVAFFAREIMSTLEGNPADIPFAALYQRNREEVACLGAVSGAAGPIDALCAPLVDLTRSESPTLITGFEKRVGSVICKLWAKPVTQAYVLPFATGGPLSQLVLIFGISPCLPFDERYETFFRLIGSRITGLLQSELQRLELLRAAIRFSALAAANPFGMVIGSFNGELRYVNPVFLKRLGYSEDEVSSGKVRWDNLTPPEFAEADARAVEQIRTSGRCDVYEKIFLAKDGCRIPILVGASIIDSPEGQAEVAAFVTDLSQLKMAEEALRTANEGLERKVAERTAALQAEVTERKRMEMSLRELTGRLLRAQDEERRHMARELHDNAGQTLAVLTMNLSAMERACGGAESQMGKLASETRQLSDNLSTEIRTLSYLLHPPLLDELGLVSAIRWYVEGFSQRSKIEVELNLPAGPARLPRELELVIFRIVQEALTNVHRHSGSSWARVCLTKAENQVGVEIEDRGKGISEDKQRDLAGAKAGVGVRGMEERVRQFGGTLQIASNDRGTEVTAILPIPTEATQG
ncbi:MAG: PAS domain S-box protein [Candidatus Acidiferrales bacterium]